ncbi:hypothetical protein ACJJTC_011953 [Scirpophaga incertulas]
MSKVQRSPQASTPRALTQSASTNDDMNVTQRVKNRPAPMSPVGADNRDSLSLQNMIRSMFLEFEERQTRRLAKIESQISEVRQQNLEIKKANFDIEKSIDFIDKKIETLNCAVKSETKGQLFNYSQKLVNTLGLAFQDSDLRDVYRLPSKKEHSTSSVVVECINTIVKEKILTSIKNRYRSTSKPLTAADIGLQDLSTVINISELLTTKGRRILYLAKDFKKTESFKYCWVAGGNVYLRKEDGQAAILIRNELDLLKLKATM